MEKRKKKELKTNFIKSEEITSYLVSECEKQNGKRKQFEIKLTR